ncbi:MAG: hypothetical protein AB1324_01640, partial [Candidatus Micrarchaeota archaeon]
MAQKEKAPPPDVQDATRRMAQTTEGAARLPPQAFTPQPTARVDPYALPDRAREGTAPLQDRARFVDGSLSATAGSSAKSARIELEQSKQRGDPPSVMIPILHRAVAAEKNYKVGTGDNQYDYGTHATGIRTEVQSAEAKLASNPQDTAGLAMFRAALSKTDALLRTVEADSKAQAAVAAGAPIGETVSDRLRGLVRNGAIESNPERMVPAAEAGEVVLGARRALDRPGSAQERGRALEAFQALTDPSQRNMTAERAGELLTQVRANVRISVQRYQAEINSVMRSISDSLQMMRLSESVQATMKRKLDEFEKLLKDLEKKLDEGKDLDKLAKEVATLEENVKKAVTETIETILKELKAPPELVEAMKTAAKFLASADKELRERGRQLIEMGKAFAKHGDLLLKNKEILKQFMDTVKALADEKAKLTGEMVAKLSETAAGLRMGLEKAATAIRQMQQEWAKSLRQGIQGLDQMIAAAEKILGNKALTDAMKDLRKAMEGMLRKLENKKTAGSVTQDEFKKLGEGFAYLADKLEKILKMPQKTDGEKRERDNLATVVGNALGAYVKDAKSELSKVLRFVADEYEKASGAPAYKSFLLNLSGALAEGKKTLAEAKKELAGRLLAEGAKAAERIDSELKDARLAEMLRGFFPEEMRKNMEGVSVDALQRARIALDLAGAALNIPPDTKESVRKTALGLVRRAMELFGKSVDEKAVEAYGDVMRYLGNVDFRNQHDSVVATMEKKAYAYEKQSAALRQSYDISDEMKDALDQLHKDAAAMRARFERGEHVSNEEFSALGARFKLVEDAMRRMDEGGLEGATKQAAGRMTARALNAMAKGDGASADLQTFIFREYISGDMAYRRQLTSLSADLESGKKKPEEVAKALGDALAGAIERSPEYKLIKDPAILASVKSVLDKARGENPSQDDVNMARSALEYVRDYGKQMKAARTKDAQAKVTEIARRAFDGLVNGLVLPPSKELGTREIDIGDLHARLARHRANPPLSFAHKKEERAAQIEAASAWVDETVTLLKFHTIAQQQGIEAARAMFGTGAEAEANAKKYEAMYNALGKDEKERTAALGERWQRLQAISDFTSNLERLSAKREEMAKKYGRNSVEASVLDPAMDITERALAKLYKGEKPEEKEMAAARGVMVLHFGSEEEMAKFFAPNEGAVSALQAQLSGVQNYSAAIAGKGYEVRQGMQGFISTAQDALISGDKNTALAHLVGMNAYGRARTNEDAFDITGIQVNTGNKEGEISPGRAFFAHRLQLDRAEALDKTKDAGEQRNINAYFDLALLAFQNNDQAGAEKMLKLANLYADALGKKDNPDAQASIALVHRVMGDHSGNKELQKRRVRDIGRHPEDKKRWVPAEGALAGIAARSVLGKTGLDIELGKETATEADAGTAMGDVLALPKERRMDALSARMAPLEARMGRIERGDIFGRSEKERKRAEKAYEKESAYQSAQGAKAEKAGDATEAARRREEAETATTGYMEKQVARTEALADEGHKLLRQASDLKMRALAATDAEEAKRLDEQAAALTARGTRLIELSESAARALKSLNQSVTTMSGDFRETGRWRYRDAAESVLSVGEELVREQKAQFDGRQAALALNAGANMKAADTEIGKEKEALRRVQQAQAKIAELAALVKKNKEAYGDVRWNGPTFETPGGLPVFNGQKVLSTKRQEDDLASARWAAGRRRFQSSSYFSGRARQGLMNDQNIARAALQYDELRPGFIGATNKKVAELRAEADRLRKAGDLEGAKKKEQEAEAQEGLPVLEWRQKISYETDERGVPVGMVQVGYDFRGILGSLFDAQNHIVGGRLAEADKATADIDKKMDFGYQTQRLLNIEYRRDEDTATAKKAEKGAEGFGRNMSRVKIEGVDENGNPVLDKDKRPVGLLPKIEEAKKEIEAAEAEKKAAWKEYQDASQRWRTAKTAEERTRYAQETEAARQRISRAGERADKAEENKLMLERDLDKAYREREVIDAIHGTGGLRALANGARKVGGAAAENRNAAEAALQDIVNNGPVSRDKIMGPAMVRQLLTAVGEMENGWDARYYWGLLQEGKAAEAYATFAARNPHLAQQAIKHLSTRGVMIDGKVFKIDAREAAFAQADVGDYRMNSRMEGFQRGYAIAMGAYAMTLKMANSTDAQELEEGSGGGKGAWFMRLRFDTSNVLQFAVAASMDPEHFAERIEKGERVYMPGINSKIRDGGGSYDHARFEASTKQGLPVNVLMDGLAGFLDGMQTFSVGTQVSARENMERMKRGQHIIMYHDESIALTNLIGQGILSGGGLAYSQSDMTYKRVPLSREEQKALSDLFYGVEGKGGGYDELYDRFANTSLSLTSVWSYTERKAMYAAIGESAKTLNGAIAKIVQNRLEGGNPMTAQELEALKVGVFEAWTRTIQTYDAQAKEGRTWESRGRAITAAAELVAAGLLTASGFGSAVGVAFGTKALYELSESSRKAGGYHLLSTKEKVMGWGGVALGFGGAALGEVSAFATEALAATRTSQQLAAGYAGEMLAAGRITAVEAQALANAGRVSSFTQAFSQAGMGTRIAGGVMMGGGLTMAGVGAADAWKAYRAGQMTFEEFFMTAPMGVAQAVMPLGSHVLPTRTAGLWQSKGIGGKIFRGSMLFLTGETRTAVEASHAFAARERFVTEFQKMPEANLKAYAEIQRGMRRPLTAEEGVALMNMMPAERKPNGELVSFKPIDPAGEARFRAEAMAHLEAAPRIEALGKAYEEFRTGKLNEKVMDELGLSPQDRALFTPDGPVAKAKPEEARKLFTTLATSEARTNQLTRAADAAHENVAPAAQARANEIAEGFKLFAQGKLDDAAMVRLGLDATHVKEYARLGAAPTDEVTAGIAKMATAEAAPEAKKMTAEEAYTFRARKAVAGEATKVEAPGQKPTFKVNDKEYTQEHVDAAADVSAAAEALFRKRAKGETVDSGTARTELQRIMGAGAEVSDARVDAALRLSQNDAFTKAAAGGDRKTQLTLALDASYAAPEVRVSKDAVAAVVSKDAAEHLANPQLTPAALIEKAKGQMSTARQFRKDSETSAARAAALPEGPARQKAEAIAERQRLIAEAHEDNAKALTQEAGARMSKERAEFRAEIAAAVKEQAGKLGVNEAGVAAIAESLARAHDLHKLGRLDENAARQAGFESLDAAKRFFDDVSASPEGAAKKIAERAAGEAESFKRFEESIDAKIRENTKDFPKAEKDTAIERGRKLAAAYDELSRGASEADVMKRHGITADEATFLNLRTGLGREDSAPDIAALAARPDIAKITEVGRRLGELSRLAVTGSPKEYAESMTRLLSDIYGGRDKIPPEMVPKPGATLYDTVKASAPALRKALDGIRRSIGFEDNIYAAFTRLNGEVEASQPLVAALSESGRIANESQVIGVIVLDGAKTWQKNGLGYGGDGYQAHDRNFMGFEVGDLGLIVYMEAARRFRGKHPEIFTKLQTAEGDEVVCVIRGDVLGKTPAEAQAAVKRYEASFRETLRETTLSLGISEKSPLFAALADVNAHGGLVGVKATPEGGRTFTFEGRQYSDLNGALVGLEVGHALSDLGKRPGGAEAAKAIEGFIGDVLKSAPQSQLSPVKIARQANDFRVDAYATFRIGFEGGMTNNIRRLAENNGKGVTHVENGLAGPSVVNQLGHPVTDALTAHFQDALVAAFKARGMADNIVIHADGPMTYAFEFKGKVDMDAFHAAVQEATRNFPKMMKERGVSGIKRATASSTHVESPESITGSVREVRDGRVQERDLTLLEKRNLAEKKAKDRIKAPIIGEMFRYRAATRGAEQKLSALIADAHLYYRVTEQGVVPAHSEKSVLREMFTENGKLTVDENLMAALEKVAAKKWVRTAEDLIGHLRASGVSEPAIDSFFRQLGFEKLAAAKQEIRDMTPGAKFRPGTVSNAAVEEWALAAGAEGRVVAPPPPKPEPSKAAQKEAAAAPREAPKPEAARAELDGALAITITTGAEPAYKVKGQAGREYSRAQTELARDIAAAAEQIVLTGKAPPGIPKDVELSARGLASNDAFIKATNENKPGMRNEQMRLALDVTEARVEWAAAGKARDTAAGEAKARNLGADDQKIAAQNAERLALEFERFRAGAHDVDATTVTFFESIKDAPDAMQRIGARAASEMTKKRLDGAVEASVKDTTRVLSEPEKSA